MARDIRRDFVYPQPVVHDQARDQINSGYMYGYDGGLTVEQLVYKDLVCAMVASGLSFDAARGLAESRMRQLCEDMAAMAEEKR